MRNAASIWMRREGGQSMVEFVIILPLVLGFIFLMVQGGVAYSNKISMTDAVRVAARAAAVSRTASGGPCAAASAAIQNTVSSSQWSVASSRIVCTAGTTVGDPVEIRIDGYPFSIGFGDLRTTGTFSVRARERLE